MSVQHTPIDAPVKLLKDITHLVNSTCEAQDLNIIHKALLSVADAAKAQSAEIWSINKNDDNSYWCQCRAIAVADKKLKKQDTAQQINFDLTFKSRLSKIYSGEIDRLPLTASDTIFPIIQNQNFIGFGLLKNRTVQSLSQEGNSSLCHYQSFPHGVPSFPLESSAKMQKSIPPSFDTEPFVNHEGITKTAHI